MRYILESLAQIESVTQGGMALDLERRASQRRGVDQVALMIWMSLMRGTGDEFECRCPIWALGVRALKITFPNLTAPPPPPLFLPCIIIVIKDEKRLQTLSSRVACA